MVTTSTLPPVRGIGAPRMQGRKPATDRKAGGLKGGATGGTKLAKAPAPAASKPVFQSAYQGGPAVEIFSAGGTNPASDWKVSGNVLRCYDKTVRGYVFAVDGGASTRMQLPKDTRGTLGLTQRFLVLQLHCPCNRPFSVELGVTDTDRTRRRLLLSTAFRDIVRNPLHAQIPLSLDRIRGCWANLCFDLVALVEASFQAQPFRTLDFICLGPTCKLRKIFTLKGAPIESEVVRGASPSTLAYGDVSEIPRSLSFPLMLEPYPVTWIFQPLQPAASPGREPPLSLQGMQIGSPRARNTVRTIKPAAAIHSPVPAAAASLAAEAASPFKSQLPAARRALMALKQKHAVARATTPRLPHPSQTSPQPSLSPQRTLSPPAAAVSLSVLLEDNGAAGCQADVVLEEAVSPQPSPRSHLRTPRHLPSFIDMPLSGRRIPISARIAMSADASLTQRTPRGSTNQTSVPEQQHRPRSLSSPVMATRSPGRVVNSTTRRGSMLLEEDVPQGKGKEQQHEQVEEEGGASPTGSHYSSQQAMPNFSLHESTDSVEEYLREEMATELGPASAEPQEHPPTSIPYEELTAEAGPLESTSPVRSIDGHSFCAARSEGPQSVDSGKMGHDLDSSLTEDVRDVGVVGNDDGSLVGEDGADNEQDKKVHMTVCHEETLQLAEPRTATPSPRSSPLTAKETYSTCAPGTPPLSTIKHAPPSAERAPPREAASRSPRAKLEIEDEDGDVQLLEVEVAVAEEKAEEVPSLVHAPARESKEHLDAASPRAEILVVESVYRPPSSSGRRRLRVPSTQADVSPRFAPSPPLSNRSRPGSRLGVQCLDEVPPLSKTPPSERPIVWSDSSEHHMQPHLAHRGDVVSPRQEVEHAHDASSTRAASPSARLAAIGGVDTEEAEIVGACPRAAGDEAEGLGIGQMDEGHNVRPLSASPTRTEGPEVVWLESRSRAMSRGAKIDGHDDIDELLSFGDDLSLYQERKLELEDLEESFRQEFGELDGLSGTPRYQTPSPAILARLDHDERKKGGKVRSRSPTPTGAAAVKIERGAADESSAHDEAKPTHRCSPDERDKLETASHRKQRSTCTASEWPESKDDGDKAQEAQASVAESDDDLVDLLYCPSLNCYVSPATGKYYELL